MTIASSNLPKIRVEAAKERYKYDTNSSTSKKAAPAAAPISKNYLVSDST